MGLSLLLDDRYGAAAAAYERAIQLGASSADAHYNLALARARLGQAQPAAQACREALRLRPGMAKAQALLKEIQR
jgi:hypothetical protein